MPRTDGGRFEVCLRGYGCAAGDDECIGRGDGILDSGASAHLTSDRSLFSGVVHGANLPVTGMEGVPGALMCAGVGTGSIVIDGVCVALTRLYYVPGMARTLISASEFIEDGHGISLFKVHGVNTLSVLLCGGGVVKLPVQNGLYTVLEILVLMTFYGCLNWMKIRLFCVATLPLVGTTWATLILVTLP